MAFLLNRRSAGFNKQTFIIKAQEAAAKRCLVLITNVVERVLDHYAVVERVIVMDVCQ